MAIQFRDIAKPFKDKLAGRFESKRNIIVGYIRAVDGDVIPPGRPNYVWFQEWAQPESAPLAMVFNDAVAAVANLPVLVGVNPVPPYRRKVIGVYHDGINPVSAINVGSFSLPLHAHSHQYPNETNPGHDKVLTYQPAIQPLKTTGGNGLIVTTQSFIYQYLNEYYLFSGGTVDLTTYAPAAGLICYILVYLDPTTGSIVLVNGTPVLNNGVIPIPLPSLVEGTYPSAFIKIADTTTDIANSDIVDARSILSPVTHTGNTLTPRRVGDILISLDGVNFEPGETLTNKFGEIITDGDGHILVT